MFNRLHVLALRSYQERACRSFRLAMASCSLQITVVYKFGGSSVADAACMRQTAEIICSIPEHLPCVVMSAMGKTTNLLLEAGKRSLEKGTKNIPSLKALRDIKELHRDTCSLLALDSETFADVEYLLTELQQLLTGMSIMQVCWVKAHPTVV
jgi:aspartate kinase